MLNHIVCVHELNCLLLRYMNVLYASSAVQMYRLKRRNGGDMRYEDRKRDWGWEKCERVFYAQGIGVLGSGLLLDKDCNLGDPPAFDH